jgi:hypothetical protein
MAGEDDYVQFSRKAAQRITNAVRRIEKQPYNFRTPSQRPTVIVTGFVEGITVTQITAFNTNINSYGEGWVQPYISKFNSNTNTFMSVADNTYGSGQNSNTNTNTNTANAVLCLNWSVNSNTVNANTHVGMCWRNGAFALAWIDC